MTVNVNRETEVGMVCKKEATGQSRALSYCGGETPSVHGTRAPPTELLGYPRI